MKSNRKILMIATLTGLIMFSSCKDEKKEMEAEKAKVEAEAKKVEEEAKLQEEARINELRSTSIAAIASKNEDLSTLVSALKAADLVETLSSEGSFTVFAPNNNAFQKLPSKLSIAELAKEENKELLTNILKYHVVAGEISSDKLVKAIEGAGGKYAFKTLNDNELIARMKNDKIIIKDEKNNKAEVLLGNVKASNGIVHVVSDVLMLKK